MSPEVRKVKDFQERVVIERMPFSLLRGIIRSGSGSLISISILPISRRRCYARFIKRIQDNAPINLTLTP